LWGASLALIWLALALLPATASATFAGTNGRIAFTTDRFQPNYEVATIKPDGTDTKRLTKAPDGNLEATYSPDGTSLLYTHTGAAGTHIWMMNADGTNKHELDLGAADTFQPSWAPSGGQLAYGRAGDQIWRANLDGTNRHQLTGGAQIHQTPAWSPNGKWIAYDRVNLAGTDHDIIRIDSKGGGATNIAPSQSVSDLSPDWRPDSSRLVFERIRSVDNSDIFTMKADGTDVHLLVGGPAVQANPVYSPSGLSIAYMSNTTGNYELWRKPATLAAPSTQITVNPAHDIFPDWQAK